MFQSVPVNGRETRNGTETFVTFTFVFPSLANAVFVASVSAKTYNLCRDKLSNLTSPLVATVDFLLVSVALSFTNAIVSVFLL